MELNSLNSNDRGPSKEHPYEVLSKLAQWFRTERFLKISLCKTDNPNVIVSNANELKGENCNEIRKYYNSKL